MLRRVKKDVESELSPKTEQIVINPVSHLQTKMYKSIKDTFRNITSDNYKLNTNPTGTPTPG